jgi:LmbE family N-acetylglucosaminyl deacetylase
MNPRRVLILSPHSDDTAFSLGGMLAADTVLRGWEKHQLTLFVHSCHAPYAPDLHGVEAITAVRSQEDAAFCASHGMVLQRLDLAETLLRGYPTIASIFAPRSPREDDMFEPVCLAVARAAAGFDLVLSPLGIGGHIEHALVREACLRAGRPALYYEDLPYAGDYSNEELDRCATAHLPQARCRGIDVGSALDRKSAHLLGYASQVNERDLDKVLTYSRRRRPATRASNDGWPGAVEVLWGAESALALLDFPGEDHEPE